MSCNRRLWTLGALSLVVIALNLALTPGAWAQSKYKSLHRFGHNAGGYEPTAGLILDQAGNLYGTAAEGGANHVGTVFELTPGSDGGWTETVLHSFAGGKDGSIPVASLIFDQAGNLYGTTFNGGSSNLGTVFKLTPNSDGSWTENILYAFCSLSNCGDGAYPGSSLIFDQAGNLYGTTEGGGSTACGTGCGTAFKLTHNSNGSWTESVLYAFCSLTGCRDGQRPYFAGLIFDQAGNLYGTTAFGGSVTECRGDGGCGVAFELTPQSDGSWTESVLHTFCSRSSCDDGVFPLSSLISDKAGNLYGAAELGGAGASGVVFQLTPSSNGTWKEKVLHAFNTKDGYAPYANLIFDQSGNLYGTAVLGGIGDGGVVFELSPNSKGGWREIVLHGFEDHPGAQPNAGVIFDAAGNLYGTTYGDSNATFGSVFEIAP